MPIESGAYSSNTRHACGKRGVSSSQGHGVTELGHGRAGQAFVLVESDMVVRATANSSPRTATDHKQGDQTAKTKLPAGSCSRILDQGLGSTRAHSSRNRPLERPGTMARVARGWAGRSLSLTPNATHFASNTRS